MLQEIETNKTEQNNSVAMSENAMEAFRGILAQKKLEGYSLRVFVSGGGCCGVNYGMALDNKIQETDQVFKLSDIQMVIDDQSLPYLQGAKIDYINDPVRGAGFIVDNPNAKSGGGCSCGSEGHGHAKAEGEGCACGGSCSCNN